MNKYEYVRVLEKNQETILAHVLKIERDMKDLRVFVRELLHAVDRIERRNGKGVLESYFPYPSAPDYDNADKNRDQSTG